VATTAPRRATLADLEALPENVIGQIIDGELIVQPRPASPHARAASSLNGELAGPFDRGRGGPGGWILLFEPELHVGGDVLVPDLAGWRRERLPEMPHAAFFELAPDWVCEVLSPGSASVDRVKKLRAYGREQVAWYWLVDPLARTLEILCWQAGSYVVVATHDGEETVRAPPFDAIELELPVLWRR
jgi:Uma2 family endonuclease